LRIRAATKKDKEHVLRFCDNTFEWGDYIGDVWDLWYSERNGVLFVAEYEESGIHIRKHLPVIGVSHASLLPGNKSVWLEGVRVNPKYRRRSVATELINNMILYGKRQGAREASAMVSKSNIASQLMMEKNGFSIVSKWDYYSVEEIPKRAIKIELRSRIATFEDSEMICNYLSRSEIYESSGKTYVNSWQWHPLDPSSDVLVDLIRNKKVLVIGKYDKIRGLAIINKGNKYIDSSNTFQIVYLDAPDVLVLKDLIRFAINLIRSGDDIYDGIQVYSPQTTTQVSAAMVEVGMKRSEQFLLYKREI
jgi:GNAT superfamily N-acetyltransferase